MIASLVVGFLLAGQVAVEPPSGRPPQRRPWSIDDLHRSQLEVTRRGIATLKDVIVFDERLLSDYPNLFTPERASRVRQGIEVMRDELEKRTVWLRELERSEVQRKRNPGFGTDRENLERLKQLHEELWPRRQIAPMPREKK